MNNEALQAIQTLNEAKQLKIFKTYDRVRDFDDTPVFIDRLETCEEDFVRAIGPKAYQKLGINDCKNSTRFEREGSKAVPSDFMKPDNPNIPEKVIIIKLETDRKIAGEPYASHPRFAEQAVLHEVGHLEFDDIHSPRIHKWNSASERASKDWMRFTESSAANMLMPKATEAFADVVGLMTLVALGKLDKKGFDEMSCQLLETRNKFDIPVIRSLLPDGAQHHLTGPSLLILREVGYDAIKALPPNEISNSAMAIAAVGTLRQLGFRADSTLPKFESSDQALSLLRNAGISAPRGFLGEPLVARHASTQTGQAPTLADLMAMKPTQPATKFCQGSLLQGMDLDWSVIGPNASKPWQPGINPAWKRQREAVEVAPPDHQPRKLPTSP